MNEARARQSSSSIGALAKQNLLATESAEEKEARLRACILQPIVYSWAWRNINHCYTLTVAQARPTLLCISLVNNQLGLGRLNCRSAHAHLRKLHMAWVEVRRSMILLVLESEQ